MLTVPMKLLVLTLLVLFPLRVQAQEDDWDDGGWGDDASSPVALHGLVETAVASRVVGDAAQPGDVLTNEARFRLSLAHFTGDAEFSFKGDVVADAVTEAIDLDIRQAMVTLQPSSALSVRAGRQVTTWGVGDFVFLNDLFPKDFVAFFIGRDDEFLKAPANAIRATVYSETVNLDVVWTPRFTPDRYITGERLSFFDPGLGRRVGMELLDEPFGAVRPEPTLRNSEVALRLFRTFGGYEAALYGYTGFTKQPTAFDAQRGEATFAPLSVFGASIRGASAGGISYAEGAYYDARDDRDGDDPLLPNSQLRALLGHERELVSNLTLGLQYYLEHILDHDALLANSPVTRFEPSETRHVVTTRWTYRMRRQTVTLSLFSFWSPNDGDVHLRPLLERQWSDAIAFALGGHLFFGRSSTFFGQFADNTNAYVRVRYSF